MQRLLQVIDERLANAGDTLPVAGHLDEVAYSLGSHRFSLPSGIDYDLMLTNAGEGILATGILKARAVGSCDRCLEPAELDITGEVDEYFLFHEPEGTASEGEFDPDADRDYALVGPDNTVDLADALNEALLMETPYVVLCHDDCKGLCPVCGANLNEGDCEHVAELDARRERERLESSPFAVLRDLPIEGDESTATMV